ncbi:MAG: hypothetical protein K6C32_02115 [Bacilli bacterium]|nr:hypothetical protein [Bacilli bacterium]
MGCSNLRQMTKGGLDMLLLAFFALGTFLGIAVNYVVVMCVWGYLHAMYYYALYGYIAGFIVTAVCLPFTLLFLRFATLNIKEGGSHPLLPLVLTGSYFLLFLTIAMYILAIFL